jgi:hypothetical protein
MLKKTAGRRKPESTTNKIDIAAILAAFGDASRLTYAQLAERLGVPPTRGGAMRFAAALAPYGVQAKQVTGQAERNGKVSRCYYRHEIAAVAKGVRLTASQRGDTLTTNVEVLRQRLAAAEAKLTLYRDKAAAYDRLAARLAALAADL